MQETKLSKVYLFDWGDTLMVDFPDQTGKMCHWVNVQAVEGALETLDKLSKIHTIYVATNAADSSERDIKLAFERVGLAQFITGYFCKSNLGVGKGSPKFFERIMEALSLDCQAFVMVGDSYEKDIEPAMQAGIQAVWFNPQSRVVHKSLGVKEISALSQLAH